MWIFVLEKEYKTFLEKEKIPFPHHFFKKAVFPKVAERVNTAPRNPKVK